MESIHCNFPIFHLVSRLLFSTHFFSLLWWILLNTDHLVISLRKSLIYFNYWMQVNMVIVTRVKQKQYANTTVKSTWILKRNTCMASSTNIVHVFFLKVFNVEDLHSRTWVKPTWKFPEKIWALLWYVYVSKTHFFRFWITTVF